MIPSTFVSVKVKHADFRPVKRPRYAPTGRPPRRFPLIRILVLVALGAFVYTRFETLWTMASNTLNPVKVWNKATAPLFGDGDADPQGVRPVWSGDSSRVTFSCPHGLDAGCCHSLTAVDATLCGTAEAVLEKARWHGALARSLTAGRPLHLEARAVVSDLGVWSHELAGVRGDDPSGPFAYRRAAGAGTWCDGRRGCLTRATARAPLAEGRLASPPAATDPVRGGATDVHWLAATPRVRAILPGRVIAVDSSGGDAGVIVRVHHGMELYAAYGPITPAPGVTPGALVKTGSYLGDAPAAGGGYRLAMSLKQGGQPVDAATLWEQAARRAVFLPFASDSGARLAGAP